MTGGQPTTTPLHETLITPFLSCTTAPFLLITDLDNTLVGDPAILGTLNEHLEQHRQTHGTRIVYATGRSRPLL